MQSTNELKAKLRELLASDLMLQIKPEEIADDLPLFGDGLALDSVDALQLVVTLDKNFGLKIQDAEVAKVVLKNINSIAHAIEQLPPSKLQ
ncbi:MAG: acyl carrier protein [Verrucomicrobia bacterium]|nr:acyl carrier protein [Verrucomicrobiota bacterium]